MVCSERERQDAAGRPVCGAAPPASAHIPARDGLGVRFGADPARSAFPTEWKAKAALAVAPTTTAAPLRGGGATLFRGGFPPVRGSRTLPGSPHSVGRWWRHRQPGPGDANPRRGTPEAAPALPGPRDSSPIEATTTSRYSPPGQSERGPTRPAHTRRRLPNPHITRTAASVDTRDLSRGRTRMHAPVRNTTLAALIAAGFVAASPAAYADTVGDDHDALLNGKWTPLIDTTLNVC